MPEKTFFSEHDLNLEIDRLVRVTGEQKRRIAELECQITDKKIKTSTFELPKSIQAVSFVTRCKTGIINFMLKPFLLSF